MPRFATPSAGSFINFSLAILSGLLLVGVFPPFSYTWLAPFALTPMLIALGREQRYAWRFLYGYFAGVLYWFTVCTWIEGVLEHYGAMGRFGGWGAFLLFSLAKGVHVGVFALLAAMLLPKPYALPAIAALWTGIERTHGPLGFAWLTLGDAGTSMGMIMRLAPFTGVYGLSFLFAMMAAAVALAILARPRVHLYWLGLFVLLPLLPGLPESRNGKETAVLVQPNAPEDADWTYEALNQFEHSMIRLSLSVTPPSSASLLIWPEAPAPLYYYRDSRFRSEAQELVRTSGSYFLFGTVGATDSGDPTNSAVFLSPQGKLVDRYDKIFLVPFGEFIPPGFRWVNRITQEAGDFVAGTRIVTLPMDGHKIAAFICYESAFPHLVRQFTAQGAEVLVNISNDGYFGRSAARAQHLKLVRMRAAENGRWILRATNDGITAVVDPAGRVVTALPPYERLAARVQYSYVAGMTFYARHGDWFAWSCLAFAALSLSASRFRLAPKLKSRWSVGA